ncbi:MAG: hypothetical protein ABIJ57_09670 [Pseudomonadota bacterium]
MSKQRPMGSIKTLYRALSTPDQLAEMDYIEELEARCAVLHEALEKIVSGCPVPVLAACTALDAVQERNNK